MKGAFTLVPTQAEAAAFAASLGAGEGCVPYTFPIRVLAAPPLREALHAIAQERGGALLHEGQTLAMDRPLGLDAPIHVDYVLKVLDGPPAQVRLEAVLNDAAGLRHGTLSTLLRLMPLETPPPDRRP